MASRRLLLLAGAAYLAHPLLKKLLKWLRRGSGYGNLDGVVSYSSRKIAAYRALESASEDPLFFDPLAEALAGPKALNDARRVSGRRANNPDPNPTANPPPSAHPGHPNPSQSHHQPSVPSEHRQPTLSQPSEHRQPTVIQSSERPSATEHPSSGNPTSSRGQSQPSETPPSTSASSAPSIVDDGTASSTLGTTKEGSTRPRMVTLIAIRTKWFDDRILQALEEGAGPRVVVGLQEGAGGIMGLALTVAEPPRPRQVVLLGAGMDSRAWRLALPPGTRWFEVDRADVLAAKQAELSKLGVAFQHTEVDPAGPNDANPAIQYPLKADLWSAVTADLNEVGWTQKLAAAGFDETLGTVWVAEGLLMYLNPETVPAMLAEVAARSAPGSVFVGQSVTESLIAKTRHSFSELLRTWCFGCPEDPSEFFRLAGWHLEESLTRTDIAKKYATERLLTAFPSDSNNIRRVLFLIATLL